MIRVVFLDLDETLVAQEAAFSGAFRAVADVVAEAWEVAPEAIARAIPEVAEECFESLPSVDFARRCGFGGRDALWGDPIGDTQPLRELAAVAPVYRAKVWATLSERFSVGGHGLCDPLDTCFRAQMRTRVAAFPEAGPVLERLGARFRLAIITNGMPAAQRQKLQHLGWQGHFEALVTSAEFGIGKPAKAIFQHALDVMGARADEALMVGDSLAGDVMGALRAGMSACWVRRGAPAPTDPAAVPRTISDLTDLESLLATADRESFRIAANPAGPTP